MPQDQGARTAGVNFVPVAQLTIEEPEILRYLGHRKGTAVSGEVTELVARAGARGAELVNPRAVDHAYDLVVNTSEGSLTLPQPGVTLESSQLARLCAGCHLLSVLAVTIGPDLEDEVSRLFASGEYALATTLDAYGSTAAEALAAYVDSTIQSRAREVGCLTTRRFSPGFGDFGLSVQEQLLALAGGERLGIATTSSYMLEPQKSVTAVIGWRLDTGDEE